MSSGGAGSKPAPPIGMTTSHVLTMRSGTGDCTPGRLERRHTIGHGTRIAKYSAARHSPMARAARRRVEESFTVESTVEGVEAVLRGLESD